MEMKKRTAGKTAQKETIAYYLDNVCTKDGSNLLLDYIDKEISKKNYDGHTAKVFDKRWTGGVYGKSDDYREFKITLDNKETVSVVVVIYYDGVSMVSFDGLTLYESKSWVHSLIADIQLSIGTFDVLYFPDKPTVSFIENPLAWIDEHR